MSYHTWVRYIAPGLLRDEVVIMDRFRMMYIFNGSIHSPPFIYRSRSLLFWSNEEKAQVVTHGSILEGRWQLVGRTSSTKTSKQRTHSLQVQLIHWLSFSFLVSCSNFPWKHDQTTQGQRQRQRRRRRLSVAPSRTQHCEQRQEEQVPKEKGEKVQKEKERDYETRGC